MSFNKEPTFILAMSVIASAILFMAVMWYFFANPGSNAALELAICMFIFSALGYVSEYLQVIGKKSAGVYLSRIISALAIVTIGFYSVRFFRAEKLPVILAGGVPAVIGFLINIFMVGTKKGEDLSNNLLMCEIQIAILEWAALIKALVIIVMFAGLAAYLSLSP